MRDRRNEGPMEWGTEGMRDRTSQVGILQCSLAPTFPPSLLPLLPLLLLRRQLPEPAQHVNRI